MVLRCVRVEAIALIERLRDITAKPLSKRDNSLTRAKARLGQAKLRYRQLVQAKAKKIATTTGNEKNSLQEQESEAAQSQPTRMQRPIKSRDEFDALRLAMPDLANLPKFSHDDLVPRQVASLVPPGNGFPLPHDPHANHSDSTRRKPQLSNNTKVRIHP